MSKAKMKCDVCGREFDPEEECWELDEQYGIVCCSCLDWIYYDDEVI